MHASIKKNGNNYTTASFIVLVLLCAFFFSFFFAILSVNFKDERNKVHNYSSILWRNRDILKCILRQKSRKQTDSNIWINFIQRQDHSLWQIFNLLSLYEEDLFLSSLHLLHLLLMKSSPLPCKSDSVSVLFFWLYKSNIRSLTLFFFPPMNGFYIVILARAIKHYILFFDEKERCYQISMFSMRTCGCCWNNFTSPLTFLNHQQMVNRRGQTSPSIMTL